MADNKSKIPAFNADSYVPVHDSFTNSDIHSSTIDQHNTPEEIDARLESLGKAEAKDNWYEGSSSWIAGTLLSAARAITSAAKGATDWFDAVNIPTSIDWVGGLSLIDEIIALDPMRLGRPSPSLVEAAGYVAPKPMIDKLFETLVTENDEEFNSVQERQLQQDKIYQESKKGSNYDLPMLKPLAEWWESNQDNKPAEFPIIAQLSQAAWWLDDKVKAGQDYIGQVDTGNKKWDYLVNGSSGLVGSIGGSMLMGMGLGKLATGALASDVLNTSKSLNKASEVLANATISAIQTNGETVQVAGDMYERSISEQIESIGGEEFENGQSQVMQDAIKNALKENPEIGKRELQYTAYKAAEKFKQEWAEKNPEAYSQIEKNALKGYHMATAINSLNMMLEPIQTSMYMRGSLASRGILSKPTIGNWKKATASGLSEYAQENINTIAEEAGMAESKGENYDIHSAFNYALSLKGFEDGAWGFVGGLGEGNLTGIATYKARMKEFQEQLSVIEQQDKIGNSDASTINQFTDLSSSYKGSVISAKRIAEMEQKGDVEGAKLEAERMLSYQAQKAFVTGTTENLIKNYQRISTSDKFTDEAKKEASKAVNIIKELEKEYNDSRKYLNANEVYYNKTDQATVKRAIQEEKLKVPEITLKGMEKITSMLKNQGYVNPEIESAKVIDQLKSDKNTFDSESQKSLYDLYEDIHQSHNSQGRIELKPENIDIYNAVNIEKNIENANKLLIELQAQHTKLVSRSTQNSEFNANQFYKKIAAWEQSQKKSDPNYSRYENNSYQKYFDDLLNSMSNKINSSTISEIRENNNNNKILFDEIKQATEKAVAKEMLKQKEENINIQESPVNDIDLIGQHIDAFSNLVEDTNAGTPIEIKETPINPSDFTADDGYDELFNNSFDPKIISDNISDELKNQMILGINQLYGIMKGDNNNFGFKDLLAGFIAKKGLSNAEHNANSLIKAWIMAKLPGYETLDFNKIKDEFFQSADQVMDKWMTLNDILPVEKTESENIEESNINITNQEEQEETLNNGKIVYDNTGTPTVIAQGNILASTDATIAYTSTYNEEINTEKDGVIVSDHKIISTEIYVDPFASGSTKLLHPNLFKPGSLLKATVHPDFMNVPVNVYDINGKVTGRVTFNEWLDAENNTRLVEGKPALTPQSAEYIAKVPMAIMDADDEIVGFIPDLGRISDFHNTPETREDYKKNVLNIRNSVHNNKIANLKIINKTIGFSPDLALPYSEAKLIKDCDENSILCIGRAGKIEFVSGQSPISEDQIVFDKRVVRKKRADGSEYMTEPHPQHGLTYDLRKCGVITEYNSDGTIKSQKDQYYPFYTDVINNLSEESQNSVYWAINTYLNKNNSGHKDFGKFSRIIYNLKSKSDTQINLDEKNNIIQLNNYIKMFVFTHDMRGNSIDEIVKKIQLKASESGTPFIFTQGGKIIIGTAFKPVTGKNGDISATNYISSDQEGFLEKLKNHLPLLRQNISSEGLRYKGIVPIITSEGEVREGYKNYDAYIRSNLKTRGDVREVTINNKGKKETFKVSFVQPRIDIALTNDQITEQDHSQTLQTGVVSEAIIDMIARKILTDEKLTPEEKVAQINASKEIQEKVNKLQQEKLDNQPKEEKLYPFQGLMLTKEELQAKIFEINQNLKNIGIKPKQNESLDPVILTDDQRSKIISSSQIIKGLSSIHQKQIVDYIFNQIAIIVNNSENKNVNIENIKEAVRNVFDNNIAKRLEEYTNKLSDLKVAYEIDPTFEGIKESIDRLEEYLDQHKLVTNNWKLFEDQALIMVKKYMNIKESISTDLKDANEDSENDADINEVSGEKDNNFSKRAEEISVKESVSADIKRLCQTIQEVDSNGDPVLGIFDVPTYVGFDTVFNSVSAWLAESDADFKSMENILKQYAETHKWIPQLLEKLNPKQDSVNPKPVNQQLQNEFVSAMCKHALDMEFVMMVKDRTGNYSLKIYSTNSGAITRSLISTWKSNIITTKLIMNNKSGDYVYNRDAIIDIMNEYQELKNQSVIPSLPVAAEKSLKRAVAKYITINKIGIDQFFDVLNTKGNIRSIEAITKEDRDELIDEMNGGKVKVRHKDNYYTAQYNKNTGNFVFKKLESLKPTNTLINWLSNFGINISPETANEIINKGFRYDSKTIIKYEDQWKGEETGKEKNLLGTLHGTLKKILDSMEDVSNDGGQKKYTEIKYDETDIDGDKILGQTIINSLASMEAKHTTHRVVQSFYDNHKSIYGFTSSKYITDRVKALKINPAQNKVLAELMSTSFSKNSMWLNILNNDAGFRDNFKVIHLGLTALKELGKTLYRDNDLQSLSDIDHEIVKLGFFQQDQGTVNTSWSNDPMYTGLNFRLARVFSPTMSDKGTMTVIKTAVLNITRSTVFDPMNYNKMLNFAYSQIVSPEMERISNFKNNIKETNIKSYDKGAGMFFLLPSLNKMTFKYDDTINQKSVNISLLGLLSSMSAENAESMNVELNGKIQTVKEHIKEELDAHIKNEQKAKIEEWKKAKFVQTNENDTITTVKFLDKNYMYTRGGGSVSEKVEIAALDFSVNSMIANANSYMTIAGDPAMCFKKDSDVASDDYMTIAKQTLINVGKRLADQIAPRNKLADSETNKYIHLFLADTYTISDRIKYIIKSLDQKEITDSQIETINTELKTKGDGFVKNKYKNIYPKSVDYLAIESTNAQEYTTWKEHLYVLEKLGKLPNVAIGISQSEIEQAKEIFSGNKKLEELNDAQKALVQKVLQPMKPVYTGQVYSKEYDVMRKMYIKTSSFPLIPQLTAGMEIDKLAKTMERIEKQTGKTVRASYESGNKVGAIATPLKTTDSDNNFFDYSDVDDTEFSNYISKFILELPRSNFGIQQNVPFKSELKDKDVVSMGTQITKLLFGNIVMKLKNFDFNGTTKSGVELHKMYADTFNDMVKNLKNDLYNELDINPETGAIKDQKKTLKKLERILKTEASLRGYPKQDLDALGIDPETGTFNLPIWLSPNAMRYEALLTSIITHRIVKIKFPGYSYVAGSQSGFKMQNNMSGIDQSNIVFTDKWTGELKGNQVLMPCKFRINGKMIDLIKDGYAKKDKDGKWIIDNEKIDSQLITNIPSFRIPSSKHSSMENLEIAGFLPYNSADLLIVSSDGTVAMGEDYDVDKRYTYHQWTTVENGKIIPLQNSDTYKEDNKTPLEVLDELLIDNEQQINDLKKAYFNYQNKIQVIQDLLDEIDVAPQYGIDVTEQTQRVEKLQRQLVNKNPEQIIDDIKILKNSIKKLKEDKTKLYQNQIVNIHSTVLNHPEVKKLTVEKLSIEDAANDANFLESINSESDRFFTPLSDRYQKSKVAIGAVGKNGTAAYSLDVVSHSLFEQAYQSGKPIQLIEYVYVEDDSEQGGHREPINLTVTFGGITSTGELGHEKTLGQGVDQQTGQRAISDVHSERQNLMVDNEKEQIAIRVHLNDYTMKVDKVLNMLGFDKGEDGRSISFMFISQPIIKKYVKMMENENSNTTDYDFNKKENIINSLLKDLGFESLDQVESKDEIMTNTYMISQIQDGGSDKSFQAAVLAKFLKLEDYGVNLTTVQTTLNIDSKGIGKNLLEAIEKLESIKNIPENSYIKNIDSLIGDYAYATNPDEARNLGKLGYTIVGDIKKGKGKNKKVDKLVMIKPTTVSGTFAVNGLVSAIQVWGNYFPYKNEEVVTVFEEISTIIGNNEMSDSKKVEIKQMIFNDLKKYLYTDTAIGSLENNAQKERFRLFFDQYGNAKKGEKTRPIIKESLASFMNNLSKSSSPEIKKLLRSNRLISRFQYEINSNGNPSLIKFNNSAAENFDEQFMYNSIIELVEFNVPLGKFNGKDYSSSDLAQDLVAYAYLEGGIQEAIQFVKYIPVSYLKTWGINNIIKNGGFISRNTLGTKPELLSTFTKQFIQHHAGQVKKVTETDMANKDKFKAILQTIPTDISTLQRFTLNQSENGKQEVFLSIYNEKLPKGQSKYQLYQLDSVTKEYVRIPVLGTFGMSEYMAEQENYQSLVNQPKNIINPINPTSVEIIPEKKEIFDRFQTSTKNPVKIVEDIAKMDSQMGKLAKQLLPLISRTTKFDIVSMSDANGKFDRNNNTILISDKIVNGIGSNEQLATVIMREVVHSIADIELKKYTESLPINPVTGYREFIATNNAPTHIKKLVSVFAEAQKALNKNGELKLLTLRGRKEGVTEQEYLVTYGGYDIFEFVERMMTTPELRAILDKEPFRESGLSISQKFIEWLTEIMAEVKKNLKIGENEGTITDHAMASIFEMFNAKQETKIVQKENFEAEKTIQKAEDLLGTAMTLDQEQTSSIENVLGSPMFDDNGDYTVDENDEFAGLDPKITNFDAVIENMLKSGSLTIKC